RDVRDPLALRFLRSEIALQQVFHACWTPAGDSSKATPLTAWPALNSLSRHQASNSVQADDFALVEQILMHARCADHATAVLMNLTNAPDQTCILLSSRAWITDRKSTRLNSSHVKISYAVFCLKK